MKEAGWDGRPVEPGDEILKHGRRIMCLFETVSSSFLPSSFTSHVSPLGETELDGRISSLVGRHRLARKVHLMCPLVGGE